RAANHRRVESARREPAETVGGRPERLLEEVVRRSKGIVGPSGQRQRARLGGQHEHRQHGLQHERSAPRGTYRELVFPGNDVFWNKAQLLGADLIAPDLGLADLRGRFHRCEVLAEPARLFPSGPNLLYSKWCPSRATQRQRGPQDLSPALVVGAVT